MHGRNFTQGKLIAIGLMSGTSMDGIDVAVLESDGGKICKHGPVHERAYTPQECEIIKAAMVDAANLSPDGNWTQNIKRADQLVTRTHEKAVLELLELHAVSPENIDLVGFHGQTLTHRPDERFTLQVGGGAALSAALGIAVVDRFRIADVAAGGQGAPFAPLYHQALVRQSKLQTPVAVLNLGGVGNVTFISDDHELMAFDTGPGNALLDDWTRQTTGEPMDRGGKLAGAGRVDEAVLANLLTHPYFKKIPPKSLDRNGFSLTPITGLNPQDGAATLSAFTALSVKAALDHLPLAPRTWIICGGGRHNPALMRELGKNLPGKVISAEQAGWRGDALEAEAFAFLAIRSVKGLPLSLPGTTGVPEPVSGGKLHLVSSA